MPRININQGTDEWKSLRSRYVTSTDSSVCMMLNPWKNRIELLNEKWGLVEPIVNQAMIYGSEQEPLALQAYNIETRFNVKPAVFISDEYPFMMTSLDGISDDGLNAVEIKCSEKTYKAALQQEVHPVYLCQMQHHMTCCNLKKMHYFAFYEGKGIIIEVLRDDEFVEKMIEEERQFHHHLMNLSYPESLYEDF